MKYFLIFISLTAMVGCGGRREARHELWQKLTDDFQILHKKGQAHVLKANSDSAFYYAGQMDYNLKIRKQLH